MQPQLTVYQNRVQQQLQSSLDIFLDSEDCPRRLKEAIEYSTFNAGKRLRPALIYAVGEALGLELTQLDAPACAIELIHSYSLVHDDLPAMDDDNLRRGQPTCHIRYDEATAILVGDAQQTLAFRILCTDEHLSEKHRLENILLLSEAAGCNGMIGGQLIDIESQGHLPDLEQLRKMHRLKTGVLIQCALQLGACQHPNYPQFKTKLQQLGDAIGLAFQVQDDILDIEGDTETLGKPQGSDLEADKSTYPKLLGLENSKAYRDQLISEAQQVLQQLPFNSTFLSQLVNYIATRNH
ncbi:polyprenyl synthetase family protein [Thiomicrorhabdus heinhorstiae]|uniref:Polyprenyl synthetase family protein n=1 Tax=Thiomicrorhabdus heinhorstiae TaxID=2748010 RepID=A0ABS0BY99_9GAMM|nr:farnesyl diphosphate synthase [Thiomicrorhabdus heinhorstiae]MBF6058040.1 polyprenyl synthetase family protein [Thiomicrorhabdus heinhorstiae]